MGIRDWSKRVMSALSAGIQQYQTYNQQALSPTESQTWDEYSARLLRYQLAELYANNLIFTDVERYAAIHRQKSNRGLYKDTRSIYNPLGRLVKTYVSKVYGGELDMDDMSGGAIPIIGANEAAIAGIRQLWQWSNWQQQKSLYVRYGAMLGDVALKIVDDKARRKVWLEVQHPGTYREVTFDALGNVKSAWIAYTRHDDAIDKYYTYEERLDGVGIQTLRDGQLYAYVNDANGNPIAEWEHGYGFCPVVWARHTHAGKLFGMSAGHDVWGKVDELTSLASRTHDQISKTVNAIWVASGASGINQSNEANDEKDRLPFLTAPEGTTFTPLVAPLDLASALDAIEKMMAEIERDTPELALHRIREGGNLTAPGVRAAYGDAIGMIQEAMGNYDAALIRAHQMALTIGGVSQYTNFTAIPDSAYENGDLNHYIRLRPVVQDTLSKSERISFLIAAANLPVAGQRSVLRELDYTDTEIDELITENGAGDTQALATLASFFSQQSDGGG